MEDTEWAPELPVELLRETDHCRWEPIHAPYSGAFTYRLVSSLGTATYLKINPIPNRELLVLAKDRLEWLHSQVPVPDVLFYSLEDRYEFLLCSEIAGDDASSRDKFERDIPSLITAIADGLRSFHNLPVRLCPFDHTLKTRLVIATYNLLHGTLDLDGLEKKFPGQSPEELYAELVAKQQEMETELVVNHGDYSMPNVIVHQGRVSGFIDLGNCGIADKYFDLAVADKSIVRNYGAEWVPLFYKAYGLPTLDKEKIRYYQLLECFL